MNPTQLEMANGPFPPGYQPSPKSKDLSTISTHCSSVYADYEYFLDNPDDLLSELQFGNEGWSKLCSLDYVLKPSEIQLFLHSTISYEQRNHYSHITGLFASKLIANAVSNGFDNFLFDLHGIKNLRHFCSRIGYDSGITKVKPTIMVLGPVDDNLFSFCSAGNYYTEIANQFCGWATWGSNIYCQKLDSRNVISHEGQSTFHYPDSQHPSIKWPNLKYREYPQQEFDQIWQRAKDEIKRRCV